MSSHTGSSTEPLSTLNAERTSIISGRHFRAAFPRRPAASDVAAGASHRTANVRIKHGVLSKGQQCTTQVTPPWSVTETALRRRAVPLASAFMVA